MPTQATHAHTCPHKPHAFPVLRVPDTLSAVPAPSHGVRQVESILTEFAASAALLQVQPSSPTKCVPAAVSTWRWTCYILQTPVSSPLVCHGRRVASKPYQRGGGLFLRLLWPLHAPPLHAPPLHAPPRLCPALGTYISQHHMPCRSAWRLVSCSGMALRALLGRQRWDELVGCRSQVEEQEVGVAGAEGKEGATGGHSWPSTAPTLRRRLAWPQSRWPEN